MSSNLVGPTAGGGIPLPIILPRPLSKFSNPTPGHITIYWKEAQDTPVLGPERDLSIP